MNEVHANDIQFTHKQTWLGVVLMVRDAVLGNGYGDFEWSKWRRANYIEYEIYMRRIK
jgi:hypothetical protein